MFLSAMEVGQGTAQELMTQEEGNSRDIDTFVQQLHSESMPEAVEGNMFIDTGRLNQKRDFVIEDVRRKGREDGTLFLIGLKMETASLESGMRTLFPVFLIVIHI